MMRQIESSLPNLLDCLRNNRASSACPFGRRLLWQTENGMMFR